MNNKSLCPCTMVSLLKFTQRSFGEGRKLFTLKNKEFVRIIGNRRGVYQGENEYILTGSYSPVESV
jgi:hypothetical protein